MNGAITQSRYRPSTRSFEDALLLSIQRAIVANWNQRAENPGRGTGESRPGHYLQRARTLELYETGELNVLPGVNKILIITHLNARTVILYLTINNQLQNYDKC